MRDAAKDAAVLLTLNRCFPGKSTGNTDRVFYFDEGPRATTKLIAKAYPRAQKSQTPGGLDVIKLPWKREARPLEPSQKVNPSLMELETTKEIPRRCPYTSCVKRSSEKPRADSIWANIVTSPMQPLFVYLQYFSIMYLNLK
jgi:hypothetical protein